MKTRIVIVGRGRLAHAIEQQCAKERIDYSLWPTTTDKRSVIVYCGSGQHFKEVSNFCRKTKTPLLLLSTNIALPKNPRFPFFFEPNTSTEVRSFIKAVSDFASRTPYTRVSIIESHQQTKKDVSGTAKALVASLRKQPSIITSVRDPQKQIKLGVPRKYLSGHAYHEVTFAHDGVTTSFSVLVLGRETYAKGAILLTKEILKKS